MTLQALEAEAGITYDPMANHLMMLAAKAAYQRRYGQAQGTTDTYRTECRKAVVTATFKR